MRYESVLLSLLLSESALVHPADEPRSKETPLIHCGERNAPPIASAADAGSRECGAELKRDYVRTHQGIGFEILDSESQACYVPDQEYRLLDSLVDDVGKKVKYDLSVVDDTRRREQALRISKIISDTM